LLLAETRGLDRVLGEPCDRDRVRLISGQRVVFAGINVDVRFLEIELGERVLIDKDGTAGDQFVEMDLQRRRIHGHEGLGLVTGSVDIVRAEIELKATDTGKRPGRRADLRWKVRQRADVVTEDG